MNNPLRFGMNKSDKYFLDAFYTNFHAFLNRGIPIVLYGIGEKTKLLLENIEGFNIIGLMDKDSVGENIYGQPVLSHEEVIEKAKCIIIVANMSVASLIYQRIAFLRTENYIDILYINGTKPQNINEPVNKKQYWGMTIEGLKREIDQNEIISFDLFDTLIMRKVLSPTDIFDLVERTLREKHHLNIEFRKRRIEAEHYCYRQKDKYCTIHDIYNQLQELLRCNDELIQEIKQIEFETELKYCTPREAVIQCYEHAKKQRKIVLITTDSFLTKEYIVSLLEKCNINGYDKLLISCEERKLKYLGDMWQHVKQLFKGHRILHIGDNQTADVEMAQKLHIQTFKIESAYDLLKSASLGHLCKPPRTIDDNVLLGQLAAKFLHNPFILNNNAGALTMDHPFSLGYLSFGPLVLHYLLWLIRKSTECKIDRLLFFARDGYILNKIYRRMADFFQVDCPQPIYFLTSRRAASVAAIQSESDIEFIVYHICKIKKIRFHQLLSMAFGVSADAGDPITHRPCYEMSQEKLVEHIINHYTGKILKNAEAERTNYRDYINTLGLLDSDKLGCVNFVGRGITQRFLTHILQKELSGFYFAKELDMLDICSPFDQYYSLYEEYISPHISRSNLAMKFIFGEVVFSSPDEQLVKFEKNGRPFFEKREVKRNFSRIKECHTGIERFIDDLAGLDDRLLYRTFNNEIVDMLYGLFSNNSCVCSEEVKQLFLFNDYYNPDVPDLKLNVSYSAGHMN